MKKKNTYIGLTVGAGIVLLVAVAGGWLKPLTRPLSGLFMSLAAPLHTVGASFSSAVDARAEEKKIDQQDLLAELDRLRVENARLQVLATENDDLKAAAGFQEREDERKVMARVISESADESLRALLIDRGAADGLVSGQAVIVADGVLIGKIGDVRASSASVLLLSDSRSRVAVAANDVEETVGVLEGDRGLSMSISLIPQTTDISPGDVIVTSGIEPGIRRGLAVGTVEKVEKSSQAPFQSASVKPFFSARHPIFVQVLVSTVDPAVASGL